MDKINKIGWIIKYLVFPAIVSLVLLAAVAGYIDYYDRRIADFINPPMIDTLEKDALPLNGDDTINIVSPPESPMIIVASFPPESSYPLSEWSIIDDPAGFIDWVRINNKHIDLGRMIEVKQGDLITIGGWAGHRLLGMRFPEILITSCGQVIGATPVDGLRADIAKNVHPNLLISGWSAVLNGDDLSDCNNPKISAWGRPEIGNALRPLNGARKYSQLNDGINQKPEKRTLAQTEPLVKPGPLREVKKDDIEIPSSGAFLYQCADTNCNILATLPEGVIKAVLIEEIDGWYLMQSSKGSGWVLSITIVVLRSP